MNVSPKIHTLIVYETIFGHTESIAKVIGEELTTLGTADVLNVNKAPLILDDFDLIVIGAPTHVYGLTGTVTNRIILHEWLDRISSSNSICRAATFGTRIDKPRWLTGSAAHAHRRRLRREGFTMLGKPGDFKVTSMVGPLVAGEMDRARDWARELAAAVATVA
ncbi:flavodoxin domain-containing protein [Aldersonia kunmingensis]|uniref:flavodoxin domain-containing protein n=1 Tax=Aldersonia kunmingensis TaxID=408066 RepID=UPI000A681B3A|nr:flavodoxin domain-containing protein [Aldersonia kunmingensis]